ncbi:MAG: hypothetical protein MUF64_13270 [Polyangiaceae bacterium]|nr:hypothetical protein [Polyangiaceae bacterium]
MDEVFAQASDPSTSSRRLREIFEQCERLSPRTVWTGTRFEPSRSVDPAIARVREALAGNPNSPTDLLLALTPSHLAAVLANPALTLLLLDQPALFEKIEPQDFEMLGAALALTEEQLRLLCPTARSIHKRTATLLHQAATPTDFFDSFRRLDRHKEWVALASHPNASPNLLKHCMEDQDPKVRSLALQHPRAPQEHLARLRRAGATASLALPAESPPPLPESELAWLAEGGHLAKQLAAINPAIDAFPQVLAKLSLARFHRQEWRREILSDETLSEAQIRSLFPGKTGLQEHFGDLLKLRPMPTDLLARLSLFADEQMLLMAAHPNAPEAKIAECLMSLSPQVRQLAAKHPNAPPGLLAALRRAGATVDLMPPVEPPPPMPEGELLELASQGDFSTLLVALHPSSTERVLAQLRCKRNEIAEAVARHPQVSADILDRILPVGKEGFQRERPPSPGPLTDDFTLQEVPGGQLWRLLARHPLTRPSQLAWLANHRDAAVRVAAATHPELPPRALSDLGLDDHPAVVQAALRNSSLPTEVIDVLVRRRPPAPLALQAARHPNTSRWALQRLLEGEHEEARASARRRLEQGW